MEKESSSSASEDVDSMQSDGPDSEDPNVSVESSLREEFHPRSVEAVHQEPHTKPEETSSVFIHDLAEHRPSPTNEEPLQDTPTNVMSADGVKVVSLVVVPPHQEAQAVGRGMNTWLARLGLVGVKTRREVDAAGKEDFDLMDDEPLTSDVNRDGAVSRSKVQFTKTADGTQTLSYEEEMAKPGDECAVSRCGMRSHQQLRQRRKLRSTFLSLLRCHFLSSVDRFSRDQCLTLTRPFPSTGD